MKMPSASATLLLVLTSSSQGTPQETTPTPVFPARADLVLLDLVVRDKAGRLVEDLRTDEVQVLEDGKPCACSRSVSCRRKARGCRDQPSRARRPPPPRRRSRPNRSNRRVPTTAWSGSSPSSSTSSVRTEPGTHGRPRSSSPAGRFRRARCSRSTRWGRGSRSCRRSPRTGRASPPRSRKRRRASTRPATPRGARGTTTPPRRPSPWPGTRRPRRRPTIPTGGSWRCRPRCSSSPTP